MKQHQHAAKLAGISHVNPIDLYDTWADAICPMHGVSELMDDMTLEGFYASLGRMSFSDLDIILQDFVQHANSMEWATK